MKFTSEQLQAIGQKCVDDAAASGACYFCSRGCHVGQDVHASECPLSPLDAKAPKRKACES